MMNDKLVQQIKKNFAAMETEALLKIAEERDNEQYSEDAFEAIKQILSERGQNVPSNLGKSKEPEDGIKKFVKERPPLHQPIKRKEKRVPQTQVSIGSLIVGYILSFIGFFIAYAVFLYITPTILGFRQFNAAILVAVLFALLAIWFIREGAKVVNSLSSSAVWSVIFGLVCIGQYIGFKHSGAKKFGMEAHFHESFTNLHMWVGIALIFITVILVFISLSANKRKQTMLENKN